MISIDLPNDNKEEIGLVVSADAVLRNYETEKAILVDVRDSESFDQFRIPGSLNIPLYAVKTKSFLKQKQLILLNNGFDLEPLITEAKRLQNAGFASIGILEGGLNVWDSAGGPTEGGESYRSKLQTIYSVSIFTEKDQAGFLAVDISKFSDKRTSVLLPRAAIVPFASDRQTFIREFTNHLKSHADRDLKTVVILNGDGKGYEEVKATLLDHRSKSTSDVAVFYLDGGLDGYEKFLAENALMRKKEEKMVVKGCGTCPKQE